MLSNPRATVQDLEPYEDQSRRLKMQDTPAPSFMVSGQVLTYLDLVSDDTEATLFGMSMAERLGMCYWNQSLREWKWR